MRKTSSIELRPKSRWNVTFLRFSASFKNTALKISRKRFAWDILTRSLKKSKAERKHKISMNSNLVYYVFVSSLICLTHVPSPKRSVRPKWRTKSVQEVGKVSCVCVCVCASNDRTSVTSLKTPVFPSRSSWRVRSIWRFAQSDIVWPTNVMIIRLSRPIRRLRLGLACSAIVFKKTGRARSSERQKKRSLSFSLSLFAFDVFYGQSGW